MADRRLTGYGKPSVLLSGFKGQIYIDQLTGDEYECKGERGFIKVDGDDQDNQFNWILKNQEKPFYEEELITIDWHGGSIVRISSEILNDFASHIPPNIPEGTTPEEITSKLERLKPIKIWLADGSRDGMNSPITSDGMVNWHFIVFCVYRDNFVIEGIYFPKRGTYVVASDTNYISGIGYVDDESPRITWDGQTTKLKKLDQKFIPSRIIGIINSDLTFTADPSFDPSTMSVFDALASGKDLLYKTSESDEDTLKCISWRECIGSIGFYDILDGRVYKLTWTVLTDGTVSIENTSVVS